MSTFVLDLTGVSPKMGMEAGDTGTRNCNRHADCDYADRKSLEDKGYLAEHCNDDCCEECFGY